MACVTLDVVQGSRGVLISFAFVERVLGVMVPVDLTLAASSPGYVQAFFKRPDRTVVMVPAAVLSAFDGLAGYLSEEGFLDLAGDWQAQAEAFLPGTGQGKGLFKSKVVRFEVLPSIRQFSAQVPGAASVLELGLEVPAVSVA